MSGVYENYIENPDAYAAAIKARIMANARKGKAAKWHAEDPTREALIEQLRQVAYNRPGDFLPKMVASYDDWGTLTPGQEAAVRKSLDKIAAKKAERAAQRQAEGAKSVHVGEVGKRDTFELTVRNVVEFETDYGTLVINIMADAADNVFVYKGKSLTVVSEDGRCCRDAKKGDLVSLKATIKAHGERDGVKQTIVARPKVSAITTPAA